METNPRHALVGAFVLIFLIGIAGFIVWLTGSGERVVTTGYLIRFSGNVTGLAAGNQVRYRGIPVGQVTSVAIDPDDPALIDVEVEIDAGLKLRQDVFATLDRPGLTGPVFVQLNGGTAAAAVLAPAQGERLARIESRAAILDRLQADLPALLARTNALLEGAQGFLSPENQAVVTEILSNVRTLTATAAGVAPEIADLARSSRGTLATVETLMRSSSGVIEDMRGMTGDISRRVDVVQGETLRTLTELQATTRALQGLSRQMEGLIAENRQPIRDFSQNGLYEIAQLTTETRELVVTLNRVALKLEREPSRFLFGDTQKGVEVK